MTKIKIRKPKSIQALPIRYKNKNFDEGKTKLTTLILSYPFHPLKEFHSNMFWLDHPNQPFCGIITECHKNGFLIFTDWLETPKTRFNSHKIIEIRKMVSKRLLELIGVIGYINKAEFFEVNNSFKELSCWIKEMYRKICLKDNEGGWKLLLINEIEKMEVLFRNNSGPWYSGDIEMLFRKTFKINNIVFNENTVRNILTSEEFDNLINEILNLMGYDWVSCEGGTLRILGNSIEEIQEKRVYKYIEKYPKVLENLDKAYKHKLTCEWNEVAHYCCKAIENFYKNVLGNKKRYEKFVLSKLINEVKSNKKKLFKKTDDAVMGGIDHLLLSGINIVGTIRNTRDSGHGNLRDVKKWEADMCYSYTILLLRTIVQILI